MSGTPTEEVNEEISVTIPKNNLVEAGKDITAVSNANAKFEIVAPLIAIPVPKPKTNLSYIGSLIMGFEHDVLNGTGYKIHGTYSAVNAGTYTVIVTLSDGYKWEDGTLEDKEIEWTIEQADVGRGFFDTFTPPADLVYDGTKKEVSLTLKPYYANDEGITIAAITYKKDGKAAEPIDAGTYTVFVETTAQL